MADMTCLQVLAITRQPFWSHTKVARSFLSFFVVTVDAVCS